jgi:hypothetical protein
MRYIKYKNFVKVSVFGDDDALISNSSSNRSWAYGGENFYAPSASKICLPRISTTTLQG